MPNTLDERLASLERTRRKQEAEISALSNILSDLLTAHEMTTNDTTPLEMLRTYRDTSQDRAREGGTERIPASFFEDACDIYATVLFEAATSEMIWRYWRPSALGWLDNRRHEAVKRKEEVLNRYAER